MAPLCSNSSVADEGAPRIARFLVSGFIESFERRHPVRVLETLLRDRTTGRNIIWADGEYERLGDGYRGDDEITVERITGMSSGVIKPRVSKEQERQSQRTKTRAEVFTPSWLVNRMNNCLDRDWFRRDGVFSSETPGGWGTSHEEIRFPKTRGRGWHAYVESRRLEITCGEAPFVCSRYDTVTGEEIPVEDRVGLLDRKLRVVTERTRTPGDWVKWALAALKATHGFEFQGDNLLIARVNVLETFCEHFRHRWGSEPSEADVERAAWVVSWNLWQMNGFTDAVPTTMANAPVQSALFDYEEPKPGPVQLSLFDALGVDDDGDASLTPAEQEDEEAVPFCVIYDWQEERPFEYVLLKGRACPMEKKFYAVIGNPPYQADPERGSTRSLPIYDKFMDEAFKVAEHVELITPARFLFNSGQTSEQWNQRMLNDRHFEVLEYEPDSSRVFSGVDIKGGVAISHWDSSADHEPIGRFIPDSNLRNIYNKAAAKSLDTSLTSICGTQCNYNFSELYADHPDYSEFISGEGRHSQLKSNALVRVPIFTEEKIEADDLRIFGLVGRDRAYRFCPRRYIDQDNDSLMKWKVVIPASNGSGKLGEVISSPVVEGPGTGFTQTFMCVGHFDTRGEAESALKYVKTKFCRLLLGVYKNTQHNPPIKWNAIPLQDFTPSSDIDWSKPISDIDRQLYRKYDLDDGEIEFIETSVKEME